ncbi:AMP-binding protein [Pelomonas sp. KK5]|uniref:AMP-binding protein n=1 Tax=Pelomonas sp. KK5 TaxID=1855730 RepID=UPI0009F86657|nr:AMP-binding protein [Pelomonas sp. KK5]
MPFDDDPAGWVLPAVLAEQARRQPDAPWFIGLGNETVTYGRMLDDVLRVAGLLQSLGVSHGDRVVIFAGNHADFVRAWLGVQMLGAVSVLLNTELRGAFLAHQLDNAGAAWAIADAALLPVLDEVAAGSPLRQRLAIGEDSWNRWRQAAPYAGPLPRAQDIACVMYTSGTSGPSKGVLMPHAHCALYGLGAIEALQITASDRYYIVLPLFHSNGLLMQLGATLLAGIPAIVRPRFSASEWLTDLREHRATLTNTLGVLAAFIAAQPASPQDRDHALRALCNAPNLPQLEQVLMERFGIGSIVSGYGMTEINIPVWGRIGHSRPGAAGWVSRWFELIVADPETDRELPRGQVGEILVRPRVPFGFMQGYLGMPEKTLEAWRNLWFHTGDGGTMDADGLLTFTDRLKDCIRRRGENIAASEVEALVAGLPGVAEVAAFAVPSDVPGGEDELLLALVADPGASLDLESLAQAAEALLPRFARPRYLQCVTELPRTATGKVQRAVLRQRGSAHALDRGDGRRA